ncbi:MAG: O-antigen ligase family protein [Bacteroidetes bacterium]|nr:O-antigen ligase family protein [Bacteroidota bacterium]
MLNSTKSFFYYSYLFGIFLLAASLPFSKFLTSVSELILFISWLADKNIAEKIKSFLKNKTALIISSVFILHLIGLAYTSDFNYGLEDVKKKIPLMLLPLVFSTSHPLSKNIFEKLLSLFVLTVVVVSFICFYVLLGYSGRQILQPQDASIFMSHIRFGLLICMAVFILGYFFIVKKQITIKIFIALLIAWLILFSIMLESETGLICIAIPSSVLLFRFILKTKNTIVKWSLCILFAAILIGVIKLFLFVSDNFNLSSNKKCPAASKNGVPYTTNSSSTEIENGNYVWQCICEKELADEWNKKSKIDYGGKDLSGNEIKYTLIRFLTSKGLNKDAEGMQTLSSEEIKAIEKGIPNKNFIGIFNPTARLQKIFWEFNLYSGGGNPSGHSVVQRFEFWKAAMGIIKENFFFGVGTGDVDTAFVLEYEKINSPLKQEWRLRSHNQFLAIGTAFGIVGMVWFLIALFYPLIAEKKWKDYFYIIFFTIAFLSMLTEDTLESQTGVTFFAFFNSLFLFCRKENGS